MCVTVCALKLIQYFTECYCLFKCLHTKRKKFQFGRQTSVSQAANAWACKRQRHLTIRVELNQTGALLCLLAGKMVGGQTAVPIILTIDRAGSVLCLICLVCQVKGAPLVLVGTKSINKPSTDLRAFSYVLSLATHHPCSFNGNQYLIGPCNKLLIFLIHIGHGRYISTHMHLKFDGWSVIGLLHIVRMCLTPKCRGG